MLIHPQFDPAAIRIGSFAIHWYGLMYLMAFAQFLLLARLRIRASQYQTLGWTYKDLEDLLFAGVLVWCLVVVLAMPYFICRDTTFSILWTF